MDDKPVFFGLRTRVPNGLFSKHSWRRGMNRTGVTPPNARRISDTSKGADCSRQQAIGHRSRKWVSNNSSAKATTPENERRSSVYSESCSTMVNLQTPKLQPAENDRECPQSNICSAGLITDSLQLIILTNLCELTYGCVDRSPVWVIWRNRHPQSWDVWSDKPKFCFIFFMSCIVCVYFFSVKVNTSRQINPISISNPLW